VSNAKLLFPLPETPAKQISRWHLHSPAQVKARARQTSNKTTTRGAKNEPRVASFACAG
jgi:hypothetical protein